MEIEFEIVKKLAKPAANGKGVNLRSIKTELPACRAILQAGEYRSIREAAAEQSLITGAQILCKSKGKSLEISCEGESSCETLLDFLSLLSWESEDVRDALLFWTSFLKGDPLIGLLSVESSLTDIRLCCCGDLEPDQDPETLYSYAFSGASDYEMGIIKKHT